MRPKERILTIRLLEKMEMSHAYASKIGLTGAIHATGAADEPREKSTERESMK